ncbi:MAG TPA: class I SAM-dependent methyltransferase [Thermoplasmata archaeon]|nr:class I SAM-dependent methyltransferase [Thermoplasmata archaeon]
MTESAPQVPGPPIPPESSSGRDREPGYRGVAMEGFIARWYTRTRGTPGQIAAWAQQAAELASELPDGSAVLEVAPGPGFFAVELARSGRLRVSALEISHTFVEIARENARRAGVALAVTAGDAARMPFPSGTFDRIVCQAAFKNFARPQAAVDEMFRVLTPGGIALIEDMRSDAPDAAIQAEVRAMGLGRFRAWMTRRALLGLRRRAYSRAQFERFAEASPFRGCTVELQPIGLRVRLHRYAAPGP